MTCPFILVDKADTKAEFLDEILTIVFRVFLRYSQSPLQFA